MFFDRILVVDAPYLIVDDAFFVASPYPYFTAFVLTARFYNPTN